MLIVTFAALLKRSPFCHALHTSSLFRLIGALYWVLRRRLNPSRSNLERIRRSCQTRKSSIVSIDALLNLPFIALSICLLQTFAGSVWGCPPHPGHTRAPQRRDLSRRHPQLCELALLWPFWAIIARIKNLQWVLNGFMNFLAGHPSGLRPQSQFSLHLDEFWQLFEHFRQYFTCQTHFLPV